MRPFSLRLAIDLSTEAEDVPKEISMSLAVVYLPSAIILYISNTDKI